MPHALFLGSSLAGIDRLDMIPQLPIDESAKKSFKMPTLGMLRQLRHKTGSKEEGTIEMEAPPALATDTPADIAGEMQDAESKTDLLPRPGTKETDHEAAMKKYKAALKSFDRITWTDLHIKHATVRPDFLEAGPMLKLGRY